VRDLENFEDAKREERGDVRLLDRLLRDPSTRMHFCMWSLRRLAWENKSIFVDGPLNQPHVKIHFRMWPFFFLLRGTVLVHLRPKKCRPEKSIR
jgi:hypothetical protein